MAGERIQGETALAYAYFEIYRDMESESRTLSALCDLEIEGKRRTYSQVSQWSSRFGWSARVAECDIERSREAFRDYLHQYSQDVNDYLKNHMVFLKASQHTALKMINKLVREEDPDPKTYRTIMLGYQPAAQMLSDLLNIFSPDQLKSLLGDWDE